MTMLQFAKVFGIACIGLALLAYIIFFVCQIRRGRQSIPRKGNV